MIIESSLRKHLNLIKCDVDLREASLSDYYVIGFWWAKQQHFTASQISLFLSVLQKLLTDTREKKNSASSNLLELKNILKTLNLSNEEENSKAELSIQQCKDIADYLHTGFFQHHSLFEFVFNNSQAEEVICNNVEIETVIAEATHYATSLEESFENDILEENLKSLEENKKKGFDGNEVESSNDIEIEKINPELCNDEEDKKIILCLTPAEIRDTIKITFKEVLDNVQVEMAQKLKDKESVLTNSITKLQKATV